MNEKNEIAQENVQQTDLQQNSPNGQKPANAKGLIIIIVIIATVIIGYYVMQSFGKNGGGSKVDLSVISDEDRLPLGMSNLQGKWERYDGKIKYIINFKSNNELVFTQYDEAGNVSAESESGTYEAKDDILRLTMTAGGQATAATCNAAVSVEKLVIKAVEGSSLFEGVYVVEEETRKEMEKLEGIINGTHPNESASSDNTGDNNGGNSSENNNENNETQPAVSDITTSTETIQTNPPETEPPVSVYDHLSPDVIELIGKTPLELIDMSETTPEYDYGNIYLTINANRIIAGYYNAQYSQELGISVPYERSGLDSIVMPIELFFSYPDSGITGKKSYTYEELKEIYGNSIMYEYTVEQGIEGIGGVMGEYKITAMVDGYWVCFGDGESDFGDEINKPSFGTSLDKPLKYCEIIRIGNSIPQ